MTDMIMADTDVVSFIFKEDTRGAFYAPLLAGKDVFIQVTLGLQRPHSFMQYRLLRITGKIMQASKG